MAEHQDQRKTSMTDEKFNNYNKWCSRSTASSFDNNRNNFSSNANYMNHNNSHEQPIPQKRRKFRSQEIPITIKAVQFQLYLAIK